MNGRYYKLHQKWICGRESTLERRLIEDHLQINAWLKSIWRRRRLYSEFYGNSGADPSFERATVSFRFG